MPIPGPVSYPGKTLKMYQDVFMTKARGHLDTNDPPRWRTAGLFTSAKGLPIKLDEKPDQPTSSVPENQKAISSAAVSGASDP